MIPLLHKKASQMFSQILYDTDYDTHKLLAVNDSNYLEIDSLMSKGWVARGSFGGKKQGSGIFYVVKKVFRSFKYKLVSIRVSFIKWCTIMLTF